MTPRQQRILDREMAFAHQHHNSYACQDVLDAFTECKRERGHETRDLLGHAAGFGPNRKLW